MSDASQPARYAGQPLRRREDLRLVTGRGRYVDDIKAAGMLHIALLGSPHAHARMSPSCRSTLLGPGYRPIPKASLDGNSHKCFSMKGSERNDAGRG
jgi:carbon-monoxide dehydrogenase large subunit